MYKHLSSPLKPTSKRLYKKEANRIFKSTTPTCKQWHLSTLISKTTNSLELPLATISSSEISQNDHVTFLVIQPPSPSLEKFLLTHHKLMDIFNEKITFKHLIPIKCRNLVTQPPPPPCGNSCLHEILILKVIFLSHFLLSVHLSMWKLKNLHLFVLLDVYYERIEATIYQPRNSYVHPSYPHTETYCETGKLESIQQSNTKSHQSKWKILLTLGRIKIHFYWKLTLNDKFIKITLQFYG